MPESGLQSSVGLAVTICVSLKQGQKEKIKARSRFKHMRGHYIGQQYGQILLRGTAAIRCLQYLRCWVIFALAISLWQK